MSDTDGAHMLQPSLLYRLAAIRLHIPPLRERREDIPLLFAHLLEAAAMRFRRDVPTIDQTVMPYLLEHDWPGNIHELGRFAERLVLGLEQHAPRQEASLPLDHRLDAFERAAIIDAVRSTGGDIGKAIAALGLARKTFYYRVNRLGIDLQSLKRAQM